jgi:hypothetical protein
MARDTFVRKGQCEVSAARDYLDARGGLGTICSIVVLSPMQLLVVNPKLQSFIGVSLHPPISDTVVVCTAVDIPNRTCI